MIYTCISIVFVICVIIVFVDAKHLGDEVFEELQAQHRAEERALTKADKVTTAPPPGPRIVETGVLKGLLIPSASILDAAVTAEKMLKKKVATVVPVVPGMEAALSGNGTVYFVNGKVFSDLAQAEQELVGTKAKPKKKAASAKKPATKKPATKGRKVTT